MLNKSFSYKKLFLLYSSPWIYLLLGQVSGTVWKEVTACYGPDNRCSQYQIKCTPETKIVLGSVLYGIKQGNQDCIHGISDCSEKDKVDACCSYNSSDVFTPFSANHLSVVIENCEGQVACAGWAPRRKTPPYSSYVWMQYACVSDKNITDMCHENTIVGNDLFIRFNISNSGIQNDLSTSLDCSCRISSPDCGVTLTTTLVDLDFPLPQLDATSSKSDTHSSACSSASLELVAQKKTFNCRNTQLYTKGHTFERMTETSVQSPNEIVSLRNINANSVSGSSYIVLYFRTLPKQPLLVNCFKAGKEANLTNHCQTMTPKQQSLDTSTSSSDIFSSAYTSLFGTLTGRSADRTSTIISSIKHGSTSAKGESSVNSTSSTKAYSTQEDLSSSSSTFSESTMPPTTSLTELFAMDSPSTSRLSHPFSRPQSLPTTSFISTRPDSNPSTLNTDGAILPNTKYSQSSHPMTVHLAEATDKRTGKRMTPTAPPNSKSTSTSSISYATYTASEVTSRRSISIFGPGENSGYMSTMSTVNQNENTNAEETTHVVDGTAQTTEATTGKTIDDSGNNNGLIVGVTVAVVLLILIIVAVVMVCLCIRIKRKEKVRRNYIRNTNIFYSFPEDYNDTGSTESDFSPEADRRDSYSNIPRRQLYESVGNPSPSSNLKKVNTPLYFDQYKIKTESDETSNCSKGTNPYSVMPNDNNYVGETSNETIVFVNGVEKDNVAKTESAVENGSKSVTFDPSVLYAKVKKEGRTKF